MFFHTTAILVALRAVVGREDGEVKGSLRTAREFIENASSKGVRWEWGDRCCGLVASRPEDQRTRCAASSTR